MGACASVQMEEAVTVGAEVAAHVTQYNGCCLSVVVVVTHRLWKEAEDYYYSFLWLSINYFLTGKLLAILTICFCCPSLPIQRPEDSRSTWSWSSTHSDAKASHSYEEEQVMITDCIYISNTGKCSHMSKSVFIPLWWRYSVQGTDAPPPF